jgi:hypothetical protein
MHNEMVSVDSSKFRKKMLAEICVGCMGCALIALAIAANQQWFDRHFLPAFFVTRAEYVRMEMDVRIAVAAIGLLIALLARRPLARAIAASPSRAISIVLAIVMAFGVSEFLLRRVHLRAAEEVPERKEPLRHLDARLGWLFVPSRVGYQSNNGRRVQYAFDANGYRVPRVGQPVDFNQPSVVFTGESMMAGEKLLWSETIPAQTSQLLGIQSANIAVSGYASDQAYLRLASELPRFKHPVAVVSLFTPAIFDRNLDDDRPHLAAGLVLLPPAPHWRLLALARRIIRYRSEESIERGIAVTRQILRATVQLAQSRGAVPLVVVPEFAPEEPRERQLRKRILDGLPYVVVDLDPRHRVVDDGHPDAVAARAMAIAIAEKLRDGGVRRSGTNSASSTLHETQIHEHTYYSTGSGNGQLRPFADPASSRTAVDAERCRARRIHRPQCRRVRRMSLRIRARS